MAAIPASPSTHLGEKKMHWNICLHRKRNTKKRTWHAKFCKKSDVRTSEKPEAKLRRLRAAPGTHTAQNLCQGLFIFILSHWAGSFRGVLVTAPKNCSRHHCPNSARAASTSIPHPSCPAQPGAVGSLTGLNPPAGRRRKLHTLPPSPPWQALSQQSDFYYLRPHLGVTTWQTRAQSCPGSSPGIASPSPGTRHFSKFSLHSRICGYKECKI